MWKHIKRVGGGAVASVIFGVTLLVTDIPATLDQMDKSFAFIAKSLGSPTPPEHAVTSAWAHPWFVVLVFLLVFGIGVFLSWACERSWLYWKGGASEIGSPSAATIGQSNSAATLGIVVTRATAHDVSLTEAALYAVTGKWGMIGGKEHFPTNEERVTIGNQVASWLSDFEQKASDGFARVWGRPQENQSEPITEIDALHWRTHEAFPISVVLGEPQSRQRVSMSREGGFDNLRVNKAEFEREWPHAK